MVDFLNTSLSGLQAAQRALATTSNNIANAATDGYSRQRVDFSTRPAEFFGGGFMGTGVQVEDVRRIYDGFLAGEVRTGTAGEARLGTFSELSGRVGDLLGSTSGGLSAGLQGFFDALQTLANDPSSIPVRQTVLGEADALQRRIGALDTQLEALGNEVNGRVSSSVATINGLAASIADTNRQIAASPGAADGRISNDLLDQRDRLLRQLSAEIEVSVVPADTGTVNVFVGNGQTLVLGQTATELTAGAGRFGPDQIEVSIGGSSVTSQLGGGTLGGLLDFQREVLNPARNDLGRTAVALAEGMNATHRQGLDLNGDFGGDFFTVGGPTVLPDNTNGGTASVNVSIESAAALSGGDYQLQYDGTDYALVNTSSSEVVALSGTGTGVDPFRAEGIAITVSGTPAAGDRFAILPTRSAAGGFARQLDNPAEIAAAFPIRTGAALGNVGSATISGGEVLDITNPDLLAPVTISFSAKATGTSTLAVSGAAVNGDSFTLTDGTDTTTFTFAGSSGATPAVTVSDANTVSIVFDSDTPLTAATTGDQIQQAIAAYKLDATGDTRFDNITATDDDAGNVTLTYANAGLPSTLGYNLAITGGGTLAGTFVQDATGNDAADTYQINGAGAFAYTSGDNIDINGVRVQISGAPAAGDEFTLAGNTGGVGDNRNAQALSALRDAGLLEGGERSLVEQADALLARVGSTAAAAQTALESQTALLRSSENALQSVSGVNLEEEAANLLRFQQAFEANARVIQTANTTFQSLLAAFR